VKSRAINRNTLIAELLSKPGTAMLLAREVDADRMPEPIRQLVIEAAVAHDDLAVRDLYENFLPDDQRTERLGDSIRAGDILQLTGDADRGHALFHDVQSVQCRSCHRIGETGNELGPNLSEIGKRLDREKLLESILKPSQTIDPKFQTWMVETNDGQVISGLLLKNTDQEIILNDAQNKKHLLASSDIDGLYPQRKSMMPDLLLRDFTAQQVADLLSYLESLK
jgi:putative heme-binding domain-containing protein